MNYRIVKPTNKDISNLTRLAVKTFIESHAHSSPKADFEDYLQKNFTEKTFKTELADKKNCYYLLYFDEELVGYSKVTFNQSSSIIEAKNIAKLERIYLLESAHGKGLGNLLFDFNIKLAKEANQDGIWLFVWVENHKAIQFYTKQGFKIVGSHDFAISETHSNPNHQLFLKF